QSECLLLELLPVVIVSSGGKLFIWHPCVILGIQSYPPSPTIRLLKTVGKMEQRRLSYSGTLTCLPCARSSLGIRLQDHAADLLHSVVTSVRFGRDTPFW